MMLGERLVDQVIGREGGYVDHPSDRGGPTRWGITEAVARRYGYTGAMRELPREKAVAIYLKRYWEEPGFDQVAKLSEKIAEELFDTGVNMGQATAAMFLQRALNGLNARGKHYADIGADGDIGPGTIAALKAYLGRRGADGIVVMLKALNVLQGARYFEITPAQHPHEDFLYGWLRTRIGGLS